MTAASCPSKMAPIKALTMKDYENQITAFKKENFNLKLRIYFLEERMQQKCDGSTEDIFKTNIELKVELESMKRDLAEKQELLVSASKALESLAARETGEPQRIREQAQRDMDALRNSLNQRISQLEECLRTAEDEVEKMAAIAEQEKLKNINMEKQLQFAGLPDPPSPAQDLQLALQEKDDIIEQLKMTLTHREAELRQSDDRHREMSNGRVKELTDELEALKEQLLKEKDQMKPDNQSELHRLESVNKRLTEELAQARSAHEKLTRTLEESQSQAKTLSGRLDESDNELQAEKKNGLKRDKTIQGLTQVLREKDKEIAELCHEIEDRDDALAKARETAHKAQMQKYQASCLFDMPLGPRATVQNLQFKTSVLRRLLPQGAEEHQSLLTAKQTELIQLQGDHHAKVMEAQKLQRALDRREQELADLQQAKEQLEVELEDLQQQKKKGDKALNDLNNQVKKLSGEIEEKERSLEQEYQELLEQTKRKVHAHEVTIQRLTSTLADKEQQLQEYLNTVKDSEQNESPAGNDGLLAKLCRRLKEKEKALEQALDERFAAMEEKDNEIHQLQLSLREKDRDLQRLKNSLSHNEETINNFDSLIKEKDVELQHLANTLKNLQRAKQDMEDNLNRSLREKDSLIGQLQVSLDGKTKDLEELSESVLSQSQSHARDLAEQLGQRLKVNEAMLAEAVKARERLVADNEGAVQGLLATVRSKDQLIKVCQKIHATRRRGRIGTMSFSTRQESAEHYNRMLSERSQEIQELRRQLSERQNQLAAAERQNSTAAQKDSLETAELRFVLGEKDAVIDRLLHSGRDTEHDGEPDYVLELRQTIQIMQEKLAEREAEISRRNSDDSSENIPVSKKTVVVLKKELAQKTEALNKALKRENQLKMSLAELRASLSELEGRAEGQVANIESLTATLETKDEIIHVLQQRLGEQGDRVMDRSPSGLPQRESTMIGGDSQQEVLPTLVALQQEHEALNKALRAEQQLYSSLVRTVKEQDSAQRLHALQLELTAVQLLRQQLEDGVKANEELRDDLERELDRAKIREGVNVVDPNELESVRHQLEDAQRWNASLQARLGAIQNRGGGVGGAIDSRDSLSFVGDQTSYMSICVGEARDDSSPQKVLELQEHVGRLQALNAELQNRLAAQEKAGQDALNKEDQKLASSRPWKQQPDSASVTEAPPAAHRTCCYQDQASQTDFPLVQRLGNESVDSGLGQSRENAQCASTAESQSEKRLASPLLHIREEVGRLTAENVHLRGLLKEQKSSEHKEKESTDASGDSSDGQADLRRARETSQGKDEEGAPATEEVASPQDGKIPKHKACLKSRLPVPVRPRPEACSEADAVRRRPDADPEQQSPSNSPASSQPSAGPSSSFERAPDSGYPSTYTPDDTQGHAGLFNQLELLHQECQEKEALINKLGEQLADWEELRAQLQDKERLNSQYVEALRAAESTIAYLTACSLGGQGGSGQGAGSACTGCDGNCLDSQRALQEKEELNKHLAQLLNLAKKHLLLADSQGKQAQIKDLCLKIEAANASSDEPSPRGVFGGAEGSAHDDSSSAETEPFRENELRDQDGKSGSSDPTSSQKMTKVLLKCLSSAESAIASLAAGCTSSGSFSQPDLQRHLDNLQRALQNRQRLGRLTRPNEELLKSDLLGNLKILSRVLGDHSRRICELEASLREESEAHVVPPDTKGLAPGVQAQLETLHKALREKKKACKNLEEKLAQSTPNNAVQKAVEQDDKGVQVDLQDLGYETTPKSANDREESSSSDLEVGVKASGSAASLPSLLTREQAHFSSTENLDSASSTPYPSSPSLSSAKVSLKSLQTYEDYGLSEDPLLLQAQVRELKVQLERQAKLARQMQRNAVDPVGGHRSDQLTDRDGTQSRPARPGREQTRDEEPRATSDVEAERKTSAKGQLQQARSRSTSPASLDSLVQSQARELSQLRQQLKESRRLAGLQRRQTAELRRAFQEMLHASPAEGYMNEVLKEQLDKSLRILDRLEGRLDKGETHRENEDVAALELSRSERGLADSPAGPVQQELEKLRAELEAERHWLRKHVGCLLGQNIAVTERAGERLDALAKELQEKNCLIQSLQSQLRVQSPNSPQSGRSSIHGRLPTQGEGAEVADVSGDRLLLLQRENQLLHQRLRGSEQLNVSLRGELDLHRSVMAHHQERHEAVESAANASADTPAVNSDLLAEHLEEIRALRRRLEESISTNDRLREQLERRLAEVEQDPAATNIFIHGGEGQAQLVNELRFLRGQNQALKEQINLESKDKQREGERLRESLARRTAKLEQNRKESDLLRQENVMLREKLELVARENARLQESLHAGEDQLRSLQCEVKLQRQHVTDSQRLLQSLRVELQVREKMETAEQSPSVGATEDPGGAADLSELLSEIRHLRVQLERSIHTNGTLRQRLEEQLWRGPGRSETININYLLSSTGHLSPDEDSIQNSPGRQGCCEADGDGSSSGESVTGAPSRLVPGDRLWANRNGRHILALVEDYSALRRLISEGRKLARGMDVQLRRCLNKMRDEESVKQLSGDVSTTQQVLDEAARLLKLVWRVSLPLGGAMTPARDQQDDLKREISRLKSRLSQQDRMLSGAVKRLRTTNQLKEGMERVIIDQLSLTHGVLKKARGNLERTHSYLLGPQGPTGAQGGTCKWPIAGVEVYSSDEL
ncbi:CDK5 regulatory subunit-associated protein 2 isoform X2 [Syngnathus typhle]|nr:CDK5 regulatory subunit-associated protein 2 isoform X2 [Syngnathus typhle]XP_061148890.1 CDK5 regulatory subunit-associated protein 2 isoform X2 [Syngnathus typhle]XP_061148891.1 CDK5 regulatory subunit-associated protein 2 isoform X2 [Syngnathus typhle]